MEEMNSCMKKQMLIRVLMIVAWILCLISLAVHNDIVLISAAILMAICIIISFAKKQ